MRLTAGKSLAVMVIYTISAIFVSGCNQQPNNPSNETPPSSEPATPDKNSAPATDQTGQTKPALGIHGPTSVVISTLPGRVQQSTHGSLNVTDDLVPIQAQGGVAEPQANILYDPLATGENEIISAGSSVPELPTVFDLEAKDIESSITSPSQVPGAYP